MVASYTRRIRRVVYDLYYRNGFVVGKRQIARRAKNRSETCSTRTQVGRPVLRLREALGAVEIDGVPDDRPEQRHAHAYDADGPADVEHQVLPAEDDRVRFEEQRDVSGDQ